MVNYNNVIQVGVSMIILIALGFFLTKIKIVLPHEMSSINRFLFKTCFIPLAARTLAQTNISEVSFMPLLAAIFSSACVHILSTFIFLLPIQNKFEHYLSLMLPCNYVNTVVSGIPIFLSIWSEENLNIVPIITLQNDIFTATIFYLLSGIHSLKKENEIRIANGEPKEKFSFLKFLRIIWGAFTSPIMIGTILGIVWSVVTKSWVPLFLKKLMSVLGDTVLGLSLFNVGCFLAQYSLMSCHWLEFTYGMLIRCFIGPGLVALFCWMTKMPPTVSRQSMVEFAQPTGITTFLMTVTAGIGSGTSTTLIFWTTAVGVPVCIMWFAIMDGLGLFIE